MRITSRPSRHALLTCCALLPLLTAAVQAMAAEPAPPAGLRAEVYSRTAAELFWDRPDVFGLRYEVRRDGSTLATTDGVSFFDDTLAAGTAYTYDVIAIDRDGRRSAPSSVTLETSGGTATSAGLAAPQGLRAEVYSRTAAELFWDRPDVFGLRYEVRRDGSTLATTDGVSFFDDTLAAGTAYTYDVIAIDRDGRRSAPSSVTLETSGGMPSAGGLPAPTGLRAALYSKTAAELFWDRPDTAGLVYEVRRDGDVLTETDGVSYFDDALTGGNTYRYEIVAMFPAGARSPAASLDVRTSEGETPSDPDVPPGPNGADAPVITADGHVALVAYVLSIYTGNRLREEIVALPGYPIDALDYAPPVASGDEVVVETVCDNGGTLRYTESVEGDRQTTRIGSYDLDDCQEDATVYDGRIVRRDRGNLELEAEGFRAVENGFVTTLSGTLEFVSRSDRGGGPIRRYELADLDYAADGDDAVRLVDATFGYTYQLGPSRDDTPFFTAIEGRYAIASPFTAGRELAVHTVEALSFVEGRDESAPFSREEARVLFDRGTLRIEDANGDRLVVSADNGDPLTADIEIVTATGRERFVQPWSLWQEALAFPLLN